MDPHDTRGKRHTSWSEVFGYVCRINSVVCNVYMSCTLVSCGRSWLSSSDIPCMRGYLRYAKAFWKCRWNWCEMSCYRLCYRPVIMVLNCTRDCFWWIYWRWGWLSPH